MNYASYDVFSAPGKPSFQMPAKPVFDSLFGKGVGAVEIAEGAKVALLCTLRIDTSQPGVHVEDAAGQRVRDQTVVLPTGHCGVVVGYLPTSPPLPLVDFEILGNKVRRLVINYAEFDATPGPDYAPVRRSCLPLRLGWSSTVHGFQGLEARFIIYLGSSHWGARLDENACFGMLYTACTRATSSSGFMIHNVEAVVRAGGALACPAVLETEEALVARSQLRKDFAAAVAAGQAFVTLSVADLVDHVVHGVRR
jgi:hypothetical protein